MGKLRFEALKKLNERPKIHVELPTPNISQFFGQNVFGIEQMRATLAPAVFKKVSSAIKNHEKIDETTADAVASAAKSWAIAKGATHFTHWFQPLTEERQKNTILFLTPFPELKNSKEVNSFSRNLTLLHSLAAVSAVRLRLVAIQHGIRPLRCSFMEGH